MLSELLTEETVLLTAVRWSTENIMGQTVTLTDNRGGWESTLPQGRGWFLQNLTLSAECDSWFLDIVTESLGLRIQVTAYHYMYFRVFAGL